MNRHPTHPTQHAPSDLAAILCRAMHPTRWEYATLAHPCRECGRSAQVIADTYLPAVVREAEARAWDEGYDAGYGDADFNRAGLSTDSDAHEHPHANPYRVEDR